MMKKHTLLYAVILMLGMAACSDSADEEADKKKAPDSAEMLYAKARDEFISRQYKAAVKSFEEVERQHPSSPWAVNAQVMSGYTSYKDEEYDTAIITLERFVKLYPNHESTPYAYYMIAICYYEQITDVGRDQKMTQYAMQTLREVLRRFPDSEYARDAKIKLDLTQDHLAGKEMQVGRYYLTRNEYLAAINRFRYVIENFQTTSHVAEALHRLVESYLRLGVIDEATRYAAVLGHNFPNSIWYRDSYALLNGGATPTDFEMEEEDIDEEESAVDLILPPSSVTGEGIIRRDAESAPYSSVSDVTNEEVISSVPIPEKVDEEEDSSIWDSVVPW